LSQRFDNANKALEGSLENVDRLKDKNRYLQRDIDDLKERSLYKINKLEQKLKQNNSNKVQILKMKLGDDFNDLIELQDNNSVIIKLYNISPDISKIDDYYKIEHQKLLLSKFHRQNQLIDKNLLIEILNGISYTCGWK